MRMKDSGYDEPQETECGYALPPHDPIVAIAFLDHLPDVMEN